MGFDEKPDPSRDIHLETGDYDDDDIIELEDIIEMPSGSIDEDEDLDIGVEILDAEPDLEFEPRGKSSPGPAQEGTSQKASPAGALPTTDADDDLLTDFDLESDEDDLFDRLIEKEEKKPISRGDLESGDEDEDLLLQPLFETETASVSMKGARGEEESRDKEEGAAKAMQADDRKGFPAEPVSAGVIPETPLPAELPAGKMKAAGDSMPEGPAREEPARDKLQGDARLSEPAAMGPEETVPEKTVVCPEEKTAPQPSESSAMKPEAALSQAPAFVTVPGDATIVPRMVDELVSRIESRLLESVRTLVEAKLPEIARDVIREEIEKIRKDIG